MANFFLAARWVGEALQRYRERPPLATLKGKRIVFSEREYTAALLHIYMGLGQNLSDIAELAHLSMEHLSFQRSQVDFMTLVDCLKTRFTAWYREILVIEEFSLTEYSDISEEFLLLDDMVQTRISLAARAVLLDFRPFCLWKFRISVGQGVSYVLRDAAILSFKFFQVFLTPF